MAKRRICHVDDVQPGTSLGWRESPFGQDELFLVSHGGRLYGYRNSCPHWPGSTLPFKSGQYLDREARHIICSGHGALFNITTGLCVRGPCLGQKLSALELEIDPEGSVFVLTI